MEKLIQAATDMRYLIFRGYPKDSALKFVGRYYLLSKKEMNVLQRVVISPDITERIMYCKISPGEGVLQNYELFIDGYNVLITVEAILSGKKIYRGDDGIIRDVEGIFGKYHISNMTLQSMEEILRSIKVLGPSRCVFLFESQISKSGELAGMVRGKLKEWGLTGDAITEKSVDYALKHVRGVIASSDTIILKEAGKIIDIPAMIAEDRGVEIIEI
jgi:hypothetical protein